MIRVTHNSIVDQSIRSAQNRFARLAEAERQVSTGKAIERASENPSRAAGILDTTSRLSRGEQYLRNAEAAMRSLQTAESIAQQVSDSLTRVRSLSLRVANGSFNEADRIVIAEQVNQELDELLRIANQKVGRRFALGSEEAPVTVQRDETGKAISVSFSEATSREPNEAILGDGERVKVGISAREAFNFGDDGDVFGTLIALRDGILQGDRESVTASVGALDEALNDVEAATTLIGSRLATIQNTTERLETAKLISTARLSELADADIVESISRFNQEEAYYQMSLQVSARIMQKSLLDFL